MKSNNLFLVSVFTNKFPILVFRNYFSNIVFMLGLFDGSKVSISATSIYKSYEYLDDIDVYVPFNIFVTSSFIDCPSNA